jgi:hypothetical protein
MAVEFSEGRNCASATLVDQWFRALDHRKIYVGLSEWLVQVTGIYVDENAVWIQISDRLRPGGSVVLRVSSTTSIDQAVRALTARGRESGVAHPIVVSALAASSSSASDAFAAVLH